MSGDMSCRELVELITDYVDGALSAEDRTRFDAHLAICPSCVTYVEQTRQTIATLRPPSARWPAQYSPAGPPPRTITS